MIGLNFCRNRKTLSRKNDRLTINSLLDKCEEESCAFPPIGGRRYCKTRKLALLYSVYGETVTNVQLDRYT
jgi:hypothetical protein